MDNVRLQRLLTIVDTAISLQPKKRPAYLIEVCGDDETLRREVLNLLKSIDKSESFWEDWQEWNDRQIQQLFKKTGEDPVLPVRIGPWSPVKLLGRGGMGTVFLAERADGQYEQQAAVKLLQHGLELGESKRRFEQERQILARLDHPNIAGFYDGGITENGQPWLAMQYVSGLPITEWCRQHNCTLNQRLELFQKVCEAVRYAHKNLIVHRDIKPDNVLVAGARAPKVLDFGIAKLLDEELSESQRIQTQTGLRVMSLDYAAPEQITGEAITTATDVYALGLLLYELLTNTYPFDLEKKNQRQVEQILRNQDPAKPSSVASKWQSKLRGDLDAITLKALRKEPDQRYENAGQLLDDIQRYHSNLSVTAQSDTVRYRARKFYHRHRGKLVATIAVLAAISSLITYYTFQVTRERNIAQQEAAKAEEVSAFLEELFNTSDPFLSVENDRPDTLQVREFLDRGAARVQKELQDQPDVQAQMLNVVGDVYTNLGLFDEALPLLEQALNIRKKSGFDANIAETLESLGHALQKKGDFEAAEQYYRETLELRRQIQGEQNEATARAMVMLAGLLGEKSAFDESEKNFRQALAIQEIQLGEKHPEVAETILQLGILFHHQANLDRAEFYYRKALELNRTLHDNTHPAVVQSLLSYATVLREKGDYQAAEPLMREVLEIQQEILGSEHPTTVTSMYELAILLRDKKEPQLVQAAGLFHDVIAMNREQRGADHYFVGKSLFELGIAFSKMKQLDEAEQTYRQSLAVFRRAWPEGHPDIALALTGIGVTLTRKGHPAEAEPFFREALEIRQNKLGEEAWRTGVAKSALGWAIMEQGRYTEAEALLTEGYNVLKDKDAPTRAALHRLVLLYEYKNQPKEATIYRRLLEKARY